jgi:autotransporter-associated beta strand protein
VIFGNPSGFAPSDATGYSNIDLLSLTFQNSSSGAVDLQIVAPLKIGAGGINKTSPANLFLRSVNLAAGQTWTGSGNIFTDGAITGSKLNSDMPFMRFDANSPSWGGGLDVRQVVGMGNNGNFSAGSVNTPFGTGTITLINRLNDGITSTAPTVMLTGRPGNEGASTAQTLQNNIALQNEGGGDFRIRQGWDTSSGTGHAYILSGEISGNVSSKALIFDNWLGSAAPATLILTGENTYTSALTAIDPNVTLQVGNGGTSGTLGTSQVIISGTSGVLAFNRSDSVTINNQIMGGGALRQDGSGTTILSGVNSYTGETTVSSGTLIVGSGGSIASSLLTTVGTGANLKVNGTAGSVKVNSGGSLGGSGTVGAVTLTTGSFLKPGNSPGLLTAASSSWAAGSTYNWEIDNATGVAGTNWDLFSVTGALDMSALSSGSKMNLVLESLSLANYSTSTPFSWTIAQAGSFTGTGFADGTNVTDLFNINATAFNSGNLPTNGFKVEVGTSGSLRTLNLMAIPEPSSHSMLLIGVGLTAVLFRRRLAKRA